MLCSDLKFTKRNARNQCTLQLSQMTITLNISRYFSTAQSDLEIDLTATHAELARIESEIIVATTRYGAFLKELGLSALPPHDPNSSRDEAG